MEVMIYDQTIQQSLELHLLHKMSITWDQTTTVTLTSYMWHKL